MKKAGTKPVLQHKESAPRRSGGGTIVGLIIGLVIGVAASFGVVLYLNKAPLPFMDKYEGAPKSNGAAPAEPKALAGKPGDKVTEKPRFDFYGILEGKTSPSEGKPAEKATAAPTAPVATVAPPAASAAKPTAIPAAEPASAEKVAKNGETYILQAGAFQKPADAENLKAKMAMLGVEATVQQAEVGDKGTMYRVRVGPLNSPEEMNTVRTQMSQGGVQATVIKLKAN